MIRHAIVHADHRVVAQYLPGNYRVVDHDLTDSCIIEGEDRSGWTLDGYVLPRLASGLMFGEEVSLAERELPEATAIIDDHFTFDAARRWTEGS